MKDTLFGPANTNAIGIQWISDQNET
ncbi:hypothetical protein B4U80_01617 [Leptotrombidium deliense]|uniref:Uncharacterized protein n=1 Tax=Leptotrombidium deliense TaxID=299467 RepID=A0A443RU85_9ACAR|nr:hypothetical protein B4U80_01617 [Leptotrombidium deliense]